MTTQPVEILLVEDNPADVELIMHALVTTATVIIFILIFASSMEPMVVFPVWSRRFPDARTLVADLA